MTKLGAVLLDLSFRKWSRLVNQIYIKLNITERIFNMKKSNIIQATLTIAMSSFFMVAAPSKASIEDQITLINKDDYKWQYMIPNLKEKSPRFTTLHTDSGSGAAVVYIEFPEAMYVPKHTHEGSEMHFLLEGSHVFYQGKKRLDVQKHGFLDMPADLVHEAWVPAGAKAIIMLEKGFKVNWLEGAPTAEDLDKFEPAR